MKKIAKMTTIISAVVLGAVVLLPKARADLIGPNGGRRAGPFSPGNPVDFIALVVIGGVTIIVAIVAIVLLVKIRNRKNDAAGK